MHSDPPPPSADDSDWELIASYARAAGIEIRYLMARAAEFAIPPDTIRQAFERTGYWRVPTYGDAPTSMIPEVLDLRLLEQRVWWVDRSGLRRRLTDRRVFDDDAVDTVSRFLRIRAAEIYDRAPHPRPEQLPAHSIASWLEERPLLQELDRQRTLRSTSERVRGDGDPSASL